MTSENALTIHYKNNLPLVSIGIIDAGSNKKIVVDAHLDFASSKTIIPTYIANEMNLTFAGSDETVTGAGIIFIPYYEVTIEVFDKKQLDKVISSVEQVPGVIAVERMNS